MSPAAAPLSLSFSAVPLPHPLPPRRLPRRFPSSPIQSKLLPQQTTPPPPGAGAGAAASTPVDGFLLRHYSAEAAADAKRKHTKKKKNKQGPPAVSTAVACCYGCGAPLQTDDADAPGYVDPDTYQLKMRHRQLRTLICGRCKLLAHGHMITAVGGHGGYAGGKQFVTAEELREKLSHLRHEKALIVKLVDIVDFNGSFLARIRDLTGANPIILVVTKVDLLPKGTDLNCVADWVVEATLKKKLNVLSVHLTSSKSMLGIAGVISQIQKEKKGRDVYILGAANVGKSAFISALLKMMGEKDPVAAAAQKYKPIQSAVPGTTLGPIQIEAFLNGGKIFDTPGVHLHHRQAAVVHVEDLPCLAPQSRLKSQLPTLVDSSLIGQSLFWGGLVRVDILEVPPTASLTFYGPRQLQVYTVPTAEADAFYKEEIGVTLTPPTCRQRAEEWPGLQTVRHLNIKFEHTKRPASDIAISGLGWIVVNPVSRNDNFISSEQTSGELRLSVYVPKAVEVCLRPPIPVGKAGGEWYEYKDLTEKEEAERPRWFI